MNKLLLYGDINVNCYFIEHNNKCFIVDPGYEKERIIDYVKKNDLTVLGILLTHGHIDHIGAIDCFDVPVYVHKFEEDIIADNHLNGFEFYGKKKPYRLEDINIVYIQDSTKLYIDDLMIKVIHTPGHTIGSVCYKVGDIVYTGDTLFKGTVGRWDFPTGNLDVLKESIVTLINQLDGNITIYPAHGNLSTIENEKKYNPYYLQWK